ncbi:NADPH-dependent glutamate synthase [uncultured Brachyspira sp.]|uniref:NADPH-dependent glutamate synthase n=1 Tax=uncultured Brachyspira sp. TaxID=221953 RepID=UPI0025D06F8E|nr:NADPH-dependent glutamate synthase [uncultured Brachyspira sp.]
MPPRSKLGEIPRQEMPTRSAEERRNDFKEVPLGYTEEQAYLESLRCLDCKVPHCMEGCPAKVKIPDFIQLIAEKKFLEAAKKIKETNALPAACGRVCPQEEQCEKRCIVGKKFEPVAIGKLEMFVADYERKYAEHKELKVAKNGKKVCIVGAGPAGLACAGDLIKLGYDVTVLEALHTIGGVLMYGIPEFRLPKELVAYEVENLKKDGVKFKINEVAGISLNFQELRKEYDAVFLGTGAGLPAFLNINGEHLCGVYSANEYLTRVNLMGAYKFPEVDTPVIRHKRVAVLGGGNVAMDACRTAVRLGAEKVYIVYRRTENELPARLEEIHHAMEEGVDFRFLRAPIEILGNENDNVKAIRTQVMELGEADSDGRRKPIPVKDKTEDIEADAVIVAIGTTPNPLIAKKVPELKTIKKGTYAINDETGATSMEGVFAGGDAVRGAATVILAIGDGKKAAAGIDKYLSSK